MIMYIPQVRRLVRSKALQNWRVPGAESQVRPTLNRDEHLALLAEKIGEEATELAEAMLDGGPKDHITEEIGDVLSVIQAIAEMSGLNWEDVAQAAKYKDLTHGDFTWGALVWDRVLPTTNPETALTEH